MYNPDEIKVLQKSEDGWEMGVVMKNLRKSV